MSEIRPAHIIQFAKTGVLPMGTDSYILRTEYKERCYIYQSFRHTESDFGDYTLETTMTFFADSGRGTAAEWEPRYGPIQLWTECTEDWTGRDCVGREIKARKHWHFPFVRDYTGDWSQLAVDDERLKQNLIQGDLEYVFSVLMRWATRHVDGVEEESCE